MSTEAWFGGLRPADPQAVQMKLFPVPQSSALARTFINHHLVELGFAEVAEDGCLVAAELVTNAILYAPLSPFYVQVSPNDKSPLIEVWDSSTCAPIRQTFSESDENGRGLMITEALSADWGWRILSKVDGGGKIVWARLPGPNG